MEKVRQEGKSSVAKVRVAFGTGVVLGLWRGQLEVPPTTAHLLTYHDGRCSANCKFCPQARGSTADLKMLSRVVWPHVELKRVLAALGENSNEFRRICIQALNYPGVLGDIFELIARVKSVCDLPISVSCQPLDTEDMRKLADAGVERVSVALDAATPELFERIKGGGYTWDGHIKALKQARIVFGNFVTTHLIVGLGESEEEMIRTIQFLHDMGITVGLFAFTPVPGTPLSSKTPPDITSYRKIQLARFLIVSEKKRVEQMRFLNGRLTDFGMDREALEVIVRSGKPFMTSGCPHCNRPFYNESPLGPLYNYPRRPTSDDLKVIQNELGNL